MRKSNIRSSSMHLKTNYTLKIRFLKMKQESLICLSLRQALSKNLYIRNILWFLNQFWHYFF